MPASSNTTSSEDECEHCHISYSLIKRKKVCAICHQSYCGNCAPRKPYLNDSYRICIVCQLILNESTTKDQLLEIKVKHLRYFLLAKNIPINTCTEKRELVDLIIRNKHLPFANLSSQQRETSSTASSMQQPPNSNNNSNNTGHFSNIQHSVSSFADQVNNFASNIQDYVTNTVTSAINQTVGDPLPTTTRHNPNSGASRPNNSSAGSSAHTTTNSASNYSQQRRPPPSAAAASATGSTSRIRRKSLSEIKSEDNIEDLNIRELKDILSANFVDFKGCVEKSELLEKVRRLYRDRQNEQMKARDLGDSTASDSELCKICMDAIVDCVFLDCGHMVTCVKCGKLLAECPICRSNIVRVVRVFKS